MQGNGNSGEVIEIKLSHILLVLLIIFVLVLFTRKVFAKSAEPKFEENQNAIDLQRIISENATVSKHKEQLVQEADVGFKTERIENSSLPKGEEVITQAGINRKRKNNSCKNL